MSYRRIRTVMAAAVITAVCIMAAAPAVHASPGFAKTAEIVDGSGFFSLIMSFFADFWSSQGARIDAVQGARIGDGQGARIDSGQGARIDSQQGARVGGSG